MNENYKTERKLKIRGENKRRKKRLGLSEKGKENDYYG